MHHKNYDVRKLDILIRIAFNPHFWLLTTFAENKIKRLKENKNHENSSNNYQQNITP